MESEKRAIEAIRCYILIFFIWPVALLSWSVVFKGLCGAFRWSTRERWWCFGKETDYLPGCKIQPWQIEWINWLEAFNHQAVGVVSILPASTTGGISGIETRRTDFINWPNEYSFFFAALVYWYNIFFDIWNSCLEILPNNQDIIEQIARS